MIQSYFLPLNRRVIELEEWKKSIEAAPEIKKKAAPRGGAAKYNFNEYQMHKTFYDRILRSWNKISIRPRFTYDEMLDKLRANGDYMQLWMNYTSMKSKDYEPKIYHFDFIGLEFEHIFFGTNKEYQVSKASPIPNRSRIELCFDPGKVWVVTGSWYNQKDMVWSFRLNTRHKTEEKILTYQDLLDSFILDKNAERDEVIGFKED